MIGNTVPVLKRKARCGARRRAWLAVPVHLVWIWLGGVSSAASADITGFLQGGWPGARSGVGISVGLPIVSEMFVVEAEYSNAGSSFDAAAFLSVSASLRLTLPTEIGRFQPYAVFGLGAYRQEQLSLGGTSVASSQGGGSFIRLIGPIAARVEIRFFQLRSAPFDARQRRVYIGASLRF